MVRNMSSISVSNSSSFGPPQLSLETDFTFAAFLPLQLDVKGQQDDEQFLAPIVVGAAAPNQGNDNATFTKLKRPITPDLLDQPPKFKPQNIRRQM